MKPRYKHDCSSCEYLGSIDYPAPHYTEPKGHYFLLKHADLYYCSRCDGGTVIARFSSEPSYYASSPIQYVENGNSRDVQGERGWSTSGPALATALLFARVRKLIPNEP